jgi:hypothetical protein
MLIGDHAGGRALDGAASSIEIAALEKRRLIAVFPAAQVALASTRFPVDHRLAKLQKERVNMRGASMSGSSASFPRVRTPVVIALARDLKTLIVLLHSVLRHG